MANQIPEEVIEEVRKANDIVDVVGEYVQLKKQGRNFFGLCPFHGEKTPSFSVTQEKQIFHCFGCGKGGNVVTFIMEMESCSFLESIRILANRVGIALPESGYNLDNSAHTEEHESILSAYNWLTKLYHHLLKHAKEGKEGYQYLIDRGIRDDTIDHFQLGFAPNIKGFTAEFLSKKGFHQATLIKAGLLSLQNDNSVSDRFRGRIIFPIRNHIGKTVAFGGRVISQGEPKYLNSAESELFQKGKLLYNFDLAKKHIRKENEVILFEGYMDVISAYQAGVKHVVATLGTSLTEFQAKILKRYVDTVIICYDGDQAGVEAAYKAANLLRNVGCEVKIAYLEEKFDPDSFIRANGGNAFYKEVIQTSDTYISFFLRYLKKDLNLRIESDKLKFVQKALQEIASITSPVEREYYLKELSNEVDITINTLMEELKKISGSSKRNKDKSVNNRYTLNAIGIQKQKLLPAYHNAERKLLSRMMQDAFIAEKVQDEIGAGFNIDSHKIIATYLYAFYEEGHPPDVGVFIEKLEDPNLKKLASELIMTSNDSEINEQEIDDYIRMIKYQKSDIQNLQELKEQQRIAEQQKDPLKAAQIAMKIIEIQKQLKNAHET